MLRLRVLLPSAAAMLAALTGSAHASTLSVNTTVDGTHLGGGQCSLREAIAAANAPAAANGDCAPAAFGPNTIQLSAGTYTLTLAPAGTDDNSSGDLNIASTVSQLTIVGAGRTATVIDASALADRVMTVAPGATVTLENLTLTNGHAPGGAVGSSGSGPAGDGGPGANGGAILNGGTLNLQDVAVTNSVAGNGGSGGSGSAAGGSGGAGGNGGGIENTGRLTLDGVTLSGDSAGNGGGGGAGGDASGSTGGAGGAGGNGGALADSAGSTLDLEASTLRGNGAGSGGPGGAGGTAGAGAPGGAGGDGGGIWNDDANVTVDNATIAGNAAGAGATGGSPGSGGAAAGGAGGAGGDGGAIADVTEPGDDVMNTTIVGNTAGAGGSGGPGGAAGPDGTTGGVDFISEPSPPPHEAFGTALMNTLLADNPGGNCSANVGDFGNNLGYGDSTCPQGFLTGDPKLGAIEDNGGPAQTISLGPGSAAIDAVPATGAGCPATDERGVRRPSGSACDIGAYEVAPPAVTGAGATNIGLTGVTLTASVAANAASGTVSFQYGTTTRYGTETGTVAVGGVTAENAQIDVRHLKPNTVYHFRAVATAMDGTTYGADATFLTTPPPVLSHLRIAPRRFRALRHGPSVVGHGGARVSYRDSAAAAVTVTVRRLESGSRTQRIGSFRRHDRAGRNRWRFSGRLRGHALHPGRYRLTLTPRFAGQAGAQVSVTFTITA